MWDVHYDTPLFYTDRHQVLAWQGIRDNIGDLSTMFWEDKIAKELFKKFNRVNYY